jgi:hypothetical protein
LPQGHRTQAGPAEAFNALGVASDLGQLDEAIAAYRRSNSDHNLPMLSNLGLH